MRQNPISILEPQTVLEYLGFQGLSLGNFCFFSFLGLIRRIFNLTSFSSLDINLSPCLGIKCDWWRLIPPEYTKKKHRHSSPNRKPVSFKGVITGAWQRSYPIIMNVLYILLDGFNPWRHLPDPDSIFTTVANVVSLSGGGGHRMTL